MKILLPLIRKHMPSIIAQDILAVQPMPPRERFIAAPDQVLIIADWRWWVTNQDEIDDWMHDNLKNWKHEGMVLTFYDEKEYMLFLLRWQT